MIFIKMGFTYNSGLQFISLLPYSKLLPSISDIIHKHKLAEVLESRVICSAAVGFGKFFHEIDKIRIVRYHERADGNFLAPARDSLVERLVDNARVEKIGRASCRERV